MILLALVVVAIILADGRKDQAPPVGPPPAPPGSASGTPAPVPETASEAQPPADAPPAHFSPTVTLHVLSADDGADLTDVRIVTRASFPGDDTQHPGGVIPQNVWDAVCACVSPTLKVTMSARRLRNRMESPPRLDHRRPGSRLH